MACAIMCAALWRRTCNSSSAGHTSTVPLLYTTFILTHSLCLITTKTPPTAVGRQGCVGDTRFHLAFHSFSLNAGNGDAYCCFRTAAPKRCSRPPCIRNSQPWFLSLSALLRGLLSSSTLLLPILYQCVSAVSTLFLKEGFCNLYNSSAARRVLATGTLPLGKQ